MAANTIGGVNLAQIAQRSLDALVTEAIPLSAVTTDFSEEIKNEGDSVTTRVPTQPVTKSASAARSSDNSTLTAKTITLNQFRMFDIGFNDLEITKSHVKLRDLFIQPGVVALIEDCMAQIFALVTNANFAQNVVLGSAAYDADACANLAQLLTTAKVPKFARAAVVKPTYYQTLVSDNAIQQVFSSGSDGAIRDNRTGRVHKIDQYEYNGTIPDNGENLAGFVAGPQAIIMAARQPATPEQWYGLVENVVEPVSGLPIQFRYHYDGTEHRLQAFILYGVAVGVAGNLYRIKSA